MDTLPRELFDAVLQQLADYSFPESARFPVLDDTSRQAILTARLVGHCFCSSKKLNDLFIMVLEETPFMWCRDQQPKLVEVSRSRLASQMTTLSLCGMNLDPWHHGDGLNLLSRSRIAAIFPKTLTNVLRRFVSVKHFRYYPVSPKSFREPWPGCKSVLDAGPRAQWGYPPDDDLTHSWLSQQHSPSWICGETVANIEDAGLALESITFPLFGNRASYCGIQAAYFPSALKRLTISLTDRFNEVAVFEPWLDALRNLTFLEVAISRNPESLQPWNSFAICRHLTNKTIITPRQQLPRLVELRIMADNQICFSERDLLLGLSLFPNMQKLGLAHILIKSQFNDASSWEGFVKQLIPMNLRRLWLLDPRNLCINDYMGPGGHYKMVKYRANDSFRAVANEVRLIDTNSIWVEGLEPPKRRNFDYPGFAIFEQTSGERPL
ncbi:hypothetical protein C7974DRAFT_188401 [Boeremia exigua]|uniref:uncharacterized protein n=1 Tax=Boeremia exigua TaxID=749465 RepID=UPI001E8E19A0|nr:uncharacterized protein C7974DRAFT_188401 [Boeremia exigua]KAH6629526.1 hypothetical protein C7974DRAFT_188401 [Boeremia exigua]